MEGFFLHEDISVFLLLLQIRGCQLLLWEHRSPWLIVHPLIFIQHSLDIHVFLIKRHWFLTVAVLITFGSIVNSQKGIEALMRQSLAVADRVLHCFGLQSTESAR
jgi:hypothetical protein